MVGKSKKGKNRLDSYYALAKTVGYRSRASFKLIQLNAKYKFLERSAVVLDLCCAPGSWMQVCANKMGVSSCILGVDLIKQKPITGCDFYQGDITHESTCEYITKYLGNKNRVCTVLNDGAPNVGGAFTTESYIQAELCIHSLRICYRFLKKGGTFVSKIFRSKEYRNVMYVCKMMFEKVYAVKPKASRETSAEIFLVCLHYKMDKNFDTKFLDCDHALKNLSEFEFDEDLADEMETVKTMSTHLTKSQKSSLSNVSRISDASDASGYLANPGDLSRINSIKKMIKWLDAKKKHGYTDTVSGKMIEVTGTLASLISAQNPYLFLLKHNKLTLPLDENGHQSDSACPDYWMKNKKLFEEVKLYIKDLKLCGSSDYRSLIKWRTLVRDHITKGELKEQKMQDRNKDEKKSEFEKEDETMKLKELKEKEVRAKQKKERKREQLFDKKYKQMIELSKDMDHMNQTEEVYDPKDEERLDVPDTHAKMKQLAENTKSWFNQDLFKEINSTIDEHYDRINKTKKAEQEEKDYETCSDSEDETYNEVYNEKYEEKMAKLNLSKGDKTYRESEKDDGELSDDELVIQSTKEMHQGMEVRKRKLKEKRLEAEKNKPKEDKIEIVKATDFSHLEDSDDQETDTEEDAVVNRLTIAKKILRKKDKHQMIEDSFNRYMTPDDEDAPLWFLEEDTKHWKSHPVISKREKHNVRAERDPSLDQKLFKKALEAKMRRKKRLGLKLEKIKKKAENMDENDGDMNSRVLNAGLKKIQGEWSRTKKNAKGTEKRYVVVGKGKSKTIGKASKKQIRRTKTRTVDKRMKKDSRNQKLKNKDIKLKRKRK